MDDVKPRITFLRPSLDAAKHISSLGQLLPSSFGVIQNSYDILHVIAIAIALHITAIAVAEQCPLETQTELLSALFFSFQFFGRIMSSVEASHMSNHSTISYQILPLQGL